MSRLCSLVEVARRRRDEKRTSQCVLQESACQPSCERLRTACKCKHTKRQSCHVRCVSCFCQHQWTCKNHEAIFSKPQRQIPVLIVAFVLTPQSATPSSSSKPGPGHPGHSARIAAGTASNCGDSAGLRGDENEARNSCGSACLEQPIR